MTKKAIRRAWSAIFVGSVLLVAGSNSAFATELGELPPPLPGGDSGIPMAPDGPLAPTPTPPPVTPVVPQTGPLRPAMTAEQLRAQYDVGVGRSATGATVSVPTSVPQTSVAPVAIPTADETVPAETTKPIIKPQAVTKVVATDAHIDSVPAAARVVALVLLVLTAVSSLAFLLLRKKQAKISDN